MWEILTTVITDGGSTKIITMAPNHTLLFDKAYARRAENATVWLTTQELGLSERSHVLLNAIVASTWKIS